LSEKTNKRALLAIFVILLLEVTSLAMLIPLIPLLARGFDLGAFKVGLLISAYSMVQFVLLPFWGRLSDILGRKIVIFLGLFGSALAYLLLAFAETWQEVCLSQVMAGFFGGNVAIASAYIADNTLFKTRSKNIGLIGAAFGAGFTIGPILGFLLILVGKQGGQVAPYGVHFVALGAAFLCLLTSIMSIFILSEKNHFPKKHDFLVFPKPSLFVRPTINIIWESITQTRRASVLVMSFTLWFVLAQIEPVLILFVQDDFLWSKTMAYGSFMYVGILMLLSQAYLVRKLIPKWGESLTHRRALFIMAVGLLALAVSGLLSSSASFFSLYFFVFFLGLSFFSIGYSLSNTCLRGAISLLTPDKKQGSVFGVHQSLSALARITGPVFGGFFYQNLSHEAPFLTGGFLTFGILALAFWAKAHFPNHGKI